MQAGSQLRVAAADAGDSLGTQRKGNTHHWKPLLSSAVKTVSKNTSLYVIVICKCSHELCVLEFNKSDYKTKPRL
jgi:hypothetical protein